MPSPLVVFKRYYETFDQQSLDGLDDIYSENVVFSDPVHKIQGLDTLRQYFKGICANLSHCRFEFIDEMVTDNTACFKWHMYYSHPSIKNNTPLTLVGVSIIKFSDKIESHEDIYDMGTMLYEHIPLLGGAIRIVKSRLSKEPKNRD